MLEFIAIAILILSGSLITSTMIVLLCLALTEGKNKK